MIGFLAATAWAGKGACFDTALQPSVDPTAQAAALRTACARLVPRGACRDAVKRPDAALAEPCLPLLDPEVREAVDRAVAVPPWETIVQAQSLWTALARTEDRRQAVVATFVLLDAIQRRRAAPSELPTPAEPAERHAVVVRLRVDGPVEVRVDGEPIPCEGCDDLAVLGGVLADLGARYGFGPLVLQVDPDVPFDRVREVMRVSTRFTLSLSLGAPPGAAP